MIINLTVSEHAKFAAFSKNDNSLIIRKTPYCSDYYDSLKDVNYEIKEGVLYISGIKISFRHVNDFHHIENLLNNRTILEYEENKHLFDLLENPPVISEIIIHRWWRNNKKIMGYEYKEGDANWFKEKEEVPFNVAVSNFKLIE